MFAAHAIRTNGSHRSKGHDKCAQRVLRLIATHTPKAAIIGVQRLGFGRVNIGPYLASAGIVDVYCSAITISSTAQAPAMVSHSGSSSAAFVSLEEPEETQRQLHLRRLSGSCTPDS